MSNQSVLGTEVERIVDETHAGTVCIPIPNQKLHFNPSQKRWDFFLITWPSIWHTQQKVSWRVNVLLCNSMKWLPTLVNGVLAVDGVLVIDLKFAKVLVNYKCFVTPVSFYSYFLFLFSWIGELWGECTASVPPVSSHLRFVACVSTLTCSTSLVALRTYESIELLTAIWYLCMKDL